jgi:hypothetical protein
MVQISGEDVERSVVGHAEKAWQDFGKELACVAWGVIAEGSKPFSPLAGLGG